MDVHVCPSCGFNLGEPDEDAYKTTCRNCGRTVAIAGHLGTTPNVVPTRPKGSTRREKLPKQILVISILAAFAAGAFALIVRELTPTSPTKVIKTPYADLNKEETDEQILTHGITALNFKGWTESETATYIEARVNEFEAINARTRKTYLSSGMRTSELNVTSTASDVQTLTKEEILRMRQEIKAREELIKKLQRIVADQQ